MARSPSRACRCWSSSQVNAAYPLMLGLSAIRLTGATVYETTEVANLRERFTEVAP